MLRAFITVGVLATATLVGLVTGPSPGCACSCAMVSDAQHLQMADAVFVGTARQVRAPERPSSSSAPTLVVFTVDRVYKGTARRHTTISTANSEGSCGATFHEGTRYLVYARDAGSAHQPAGGAPLVVGLCDGSRTLGHATPAVGSGLGDGSPPGPGGSAALPPRQGSVWPSVLLATAVALALLALPLALWRRRRAVRISGSP